MAEEKKNTSAIPNSSLKMCLYAVTVRKIGQVCNDSQQCVK